MTNRILVPIDLSHDVTFDLIFPATTTLARHHSATLHLLAVVPGELGAFPYVQRGLIDDARKQAAAQLDDFARMEYAEDINWETEALVGPVAKTIVRRAADLEAGLIAIASHDPRASDLLLGGTADRVVRRAHCTVVVLRSNPNWTWSA